MMQDLLKRLEDKGVNLGPNANLMYVLNAMPAPVQARGGLWWDLKIEKTERGFRAWYVDKMTATATSNDYFETPLEALLNLMLHMIEYEGMKNVFLSRMKVA